MHLFLGLGLFAAAVSVALLLAGVAVSMGRSIGFVVVSVVSLPSGGYGLLAVGLGARISPWMLASFALTVCLGLYCLARIVGLIGPKLAGTPK